jgi:hypothetical protein
MQSSSNSRFYLSRLFSVAAVSFISFVSLAQDKPRPVLIPVHAPYAQQLAVRVGARHPEVTKLGLHAIPPGQTDDLIIACSIPSKIGKKSSAKDMSALASGKPSVVKVDKEQIYDLLIALPDASSKQVGFLVMEIPLSRAKNEDDALAMGIKVRDEFSREIKNKEQLFQ